MYGTFIDYGGIESQMLHLEFDQEMEVKLKECKTKEEKEEVIKEYISKRLIVLLIAFIILLVLGVTFGLIIYFCK